MRLTWSLIVAIVAAGCSDADEVRQLKQELLEVKNKADATEIKWQAREHRIDALENEQKFQRLWELVDGNVSLTSTGFGNLPEYPVFVSVDKVKEDRGGLTLEGEALNGLSFTMENLQLRFRQSSKPTDPGTKVLVGTIASGRARRFSVHMPGLPADTGFVHVEVADFIFRYER